MLPSPKKQEAINLRILKKLEKQYKVGSYIESQEYVTERMRSIMVDWLVSVHRRFKLLTETLFLAVTVFDRYMEKQRLDPLTIQIVAIASLLVAARHEEVVAPELRDLAVATRRAWRLPCSAGDVASLSNTIWNTLHGNFNIPTIATFLKIFLKASRADEMTTHMAFYLAERSVQEYSVLQFRPSKVAATALYISRKTFSRKFDGPVWSYTLINSTVYAEENLFACAQWMELSFIAGRNAALPPITGSPTTTTTTTTTTTSTCITWNYLPPLTAPDDVGFGSGRAVHKKYSNPALSGVAKVRIPQMLGNLSPGKCSSH